MPSHTGYRELDTELKGPRKYLNIVYQREAGDLL